MTLLRNSFPPESSIIPTTTLGSNPIFLDQLDCNSMDTDLLECNRFLSLGLHTCTHSQDVSVRCTGEEVVARCSHDNLNGYDLQLLTDINECEEGQHLCEQICINTVGNYTCECEPGYSIHPNGLNCSGN